MIKITKSITLIISFTFLVSLFSSQNLKATPALAIPVVIETPWILAFFTTLYYGITGTFNALRDDVNGDGEGDGDEHPVPAKGTITSPDDSADPDFEESSGWTIGPDGDTYGSDAPGVEIF